MHNYALSEKTVNRAFFFHFGLYEWYFYIAYAFVGVCFSDKKCMGVFKVIY